MTRIDEIKRVIESEPGICTFAIAKYMDIAVSQVNTYVSMLMANGTLRREKRPTPNSRPRYAYYMNHDKPVEAAAVTPTVFFESRGFDGVDIDAIHRNPKYSSRVPT